MQDIQKIIEGYKKQFNNTTDLVTREFESADNKQCVLIYLENTVDALLLSENVIECIQRMQLGADNQEIVENCQKRIIGFAQVSLAEDKKDCEDGILNGFGMLYIEGCDEVIKIQCPKWVARQPAEPPTSAVIRGPREGFVEDINLNLSLLRKRLKTTNFVVEKMQIGRETHTQVRICYLQNVANQKIIEKIKEKLNKIDIDGIVDSSYLSAYLGHHRHSLFRQVGSTEKPDIATAKILEGRVLILVDGSPIALTLPYLLIEDLQNSDDYYSVPAKATFLRWIRFFGVVIAILLPGTYVAMLLYHYNIIPIKFLVTIMNSIQGIPLPPFLEVLFIIFLFEILYEASLRMPRYLGLALSVVGALILGDTAVKAGLISPPAVLIVAVTGVMSYTIPEQTAQISALRLIFTIVGGVLGLYGIIVGAMILVAYLSNMDNYRTSYLAPIAPFILNDQKDALIKKPLYSQIHRPQSIPSKTKRRIGNEQQD